MGDVVNMKGDTFLWLLPPIMLFGWMWMAGLQNQPRK